MTVVLERTWIGEDLGDRLDRAIEWLLIGLLAFMPLAFGVVEAWSEEIVILLAAAVSICFCLRLMFTRDMPLTWTWAYLPAAAFILVAIVQIVPLPAALVGLISPQTESRKMELLSQIRGSGELPSRMTMSFYVHATRHDLRLVLAAAALFLVTLNTLRRPDQIARLLGAVAATGGAVAVLAIVQAAFGNGKLYWFVPSPHGAALSGPFVNHSHFAQFMNLSIGAAIGLILMRLHRRFSGRPVTPALVAEYLASRDGKILLGLMLMAALGVASIFISLSRGGMISTMIAGVFVVFTVGLTRSMKGSGWILAVLALMAFACVLYVGFDAVYDRLGTLRELGRAEGGRWQIVRDVALAWTRFPVLGTGLGTHEVVYPMFDRSTVAAIASHAENEYAQVAEETGAVGFLALVVFGIVVWTGYVRVLRNLHAPIQSTVYGLGFGLTAILVHSLSDFGQHLPANGFLSVVFCALVIRLRSIPVNAGRDAGRVGSYRGLLGLLLACAAFGWALHGADAGRQGAAHWTQALAVEADLLRRDWPAEPERYVPLIRHAQAAADLEPDNITYRYGLPVYRWRAVSRAADPNGAEASASPQGREFVARIVAELQEACLRCPTFGPTWSILGQLERLVLDRREGEDHIQTGYRLAPGDPTACLVAGCLDAESGRVEEAYAKLQRAVKLDAGCYPDAAAVLVRDLQRPDLVLELVGAHPRLAGQLARMLDDDADLTQEVDAKLVDLLEQKCRGDSVAAEWYAMLADAQRRRGNAKTAIACYRKALDVEYGQIQWRLRLSQLLAEQGFVPQAIQQARICLRLSPGNPAADRLLDRLSVQSPQGDGH